MGQSEPGLIDPRTLGAHDRGYSRQFVHVEFNIEFPGQAARLKG
jgi:hypothetical protein